MQTFEPTHQLVSRSRKVPVRTVAKGRDLLIYTEADWQTAAPSFELRPKLGLFCRGIQILGHKLEPINVEANAATSGTRAAESAVSS